MKKQTSHNMDSEPTSHATHLGARALHAIASLASDECTFLEKNGKNHLLFENPPDKTAVSGIQRIIYVDHANQEECHIRVVYAHPPRSLQPMMAISFNPPTFNSESQEEDIVRMLRLQQEEEDEEEEEVDAEPCDLHELLYKLSKQAQDTLSMSHEKHTMKIKRKKLDNSRVRIGNEVLWRVTTTGAPMLLLDITYSYWSFEHESEVVQLMRLFLDAAHMQADVKAASENESTEHAWW